MSSPVQAGRHIETDILDAASDLLASGGIEALSMRAVGDRVGVSATALYHYFDGKQDLVQRVVRRGFERFSASLHAAAGAHPRGSSERIVALGQAYIRFAREHAAYFRVLFSLDLPDRRSLAELPAGGGYEILRQAVADGIEAGTLRPADPDLMSLHLWSLCHGLVTLEMSCRFEDCRSGGHAPTPTALDLFEAFREFIRKGILADAVGDPVPVATQPRESR